MSAEPAALQPEPGARSVPPLIVALVNNMPDPAMKQTEAQFHSLLSAAAAGREVQLRLFTLSELPRGTVARQRIAALYRPLTDLADPAIDGLIVTGMEPGPGALPEEPFWASFASVADLARERAMPTVWSCLAAHAAVLHYDGVARHRRMRKLSGVFTSVRALAGHELAAGMPPCWRTPHSRHFELREPELTAAGYRILSRAQCAGVDSFTRDDLPHLFLQGHPEYDAHALLREYVRDVRRLLGGERPDHPDIPHGCIDEVTLAALRCLRKREADEPAPKVLAELGAVLRAAPAQSDWTGAARTLFANWLGLMGVVRARAAAGVFAS